MTSGVGYLPRHLDEPLARALEAFPIVVVDGPRAVGKTTTAERVAASTLMLPRDLDQLRTDPERVLSALEPPVLIDEWQLAGTDLLWTLKRLVDADPTPGRFMLTGSVEPATYGPTYPLTGRAARLVLRPMTLAELAGRGARPTFLDRLTDEQGVAPARTTSGVDWSWFSRAGFPGARLLDDPGLFLDSYAMLVAQRAGEEGRDAFRLLNALRVLATLESHAVPDQRIWESADITKVTWKAYDDLLARTHVSAPIPALRSNRLKRLTSYPKRHLADTTLALTLAGTTVAQLERTPTLAGQYIEALVSQQLHPQVDGIRGSLSHLRTAAGEREVDLVVEAGRNTYAFEVKHRTSVTASDARHLAWMRDSLDVRFTLGFVVYQGRDLYPIDDQIWALPFRALAGID